MEITYKNQNTFSPLQTLPTRLSQLNAKTVPSSRISPGQQEQRKEGMGSSVCLSVTPHLRRLCVMTNHSSYVTACHPLELTGSIEGSASPLTYVSAGSSQCRGDSSAVVSFLVHYTHTGSGMRIAGTAGISKVRPLLAIPALPADPFKLSAAALGARSALTMSVYFQRSQIEKLRHSMQNQNKEEETKDAFRYLDAFSAAFMVNS